MKHIRDEILSAWVEGEVTGAKRREVADHLEECARCQEAVDMLRRIRRAAAEPPARWSGKDASWDGIAARIGREPATYRRRRPRWPVVGLAAAAVLAALLLVPDTERGVDPVLDALLQADRRVSQDVIALASRARASQPEMTAAVLAANREIDRGVDSLRVTLRDRPDDPALPELVRRATSHRIDLLREVTR